MTTRATSVEDHVPNRWRIGCGQFRSLNTLHQRTPPSLVSSLEGLLMKFWFFVWWGRLPGNARRILEATYRETHGS